MADNIRGINIDFVAIGNAGNAGDTSSGANPLGGGAVGYDYRIGKYEITNAQWDAFTGAAGAPTGNDSHAYIRSAYYTGVQQPTGNVSWLEAIQFCNWLTSGDKSKGAYQFSGNDANPGYFLGVNRAAAISSYGLTYVIPTENEWYKAAYFKPDGSGYSRYANGLNTIPAADNGWNYSGGAYSAPWNVGTGTQEQNGTFDMMGNAWEWTENLASGYDFSYILRGGSFAITATDLASLSRYYYCFSDYESSSNGFRIAEIPEPASAVLMTTAGLFLTLKRRKV
ncbi:MAG: SUMF1/EgtB/PvdO family nonheme iron enzyme [Sedimentisphaerales bacterium]